MNFIPGLPTKSTYRVPCCIGSDALSPYHELISVVLQNMDYFLDITRLWFILCTVKDVAPIDDGKLD